MFSNDRILDEKDRWSDFTEVSWEEDNLQKSNHHKNSQKL